MEKQINLKYDVLAYNEGFETGRKFEANIIYDSVTGRRKPMDVDNLKRQSFVRAEQKEMIFNEIRKNKDENYVAAFIAGFEAGIVDFRQSDTIDQVNFVSRRQM